MAVRTAAARQPNQRLAALIHEAACSNAGLARRVNMVGAEHGLDLRYDKTSVARWLIASLSSSLARSPSSPMIRSWTAALIR